MNANKDDDSASALTIFLVRFLAAAGLVLLTYNPTRYCFVSWLREALSAHSAGPLHALAGVVLLIGWTVFLRTSWAALGMLGLVLAGALIGALLWVLVDFELLAFRSLNAVAWVGLVALAALLAVGMSWSHWKRRASGQVGVEEVEH